MRNITSYCSPKDIYLDIKLPSCKKNTDCIDYFLKNFQIPYTENELVDIRKNLLERENICSTTITDSIIIPRCRSNIKGSPTLTIFRPIQSQKKENHKLYFLMILPISAKNDHFLILSKIVKLGKNKEYLKQLFQSNSNEIFYKHLQDFDKMLTQKD